MTTRSRITSFGPSGVEARQDLLASEAPMEIRLDDTPLAVIMRTPGDEEDLALGFALTEGIVSSPTEIADVRRLPGDPEDARWELVLAPGVAVDAEQFRRNAYTTSSCGICGKASIDAVRVAAPAAIEGPMVDADVLLALPSRLQAQQDAFAATGGLHAAGAFTPFGELVDIREDVGRHNAVDKLVGALAVERWPLGGLVLMVSGRASFEIVQ
ncbi:MAG: formate dehydrogenase accessory sulfurtransferase FdhD, partial [Acidimicrobiia bacterium]